MEDQGDARALRRLVEGLDLAGAALALLKTRADEELQALCARIETAEPVPLPPEPAIAWEPGREGKPLTDLQREWLRERAEQRGPAGRAWLPAIREAVTDRDGLDIRAHLERLPLVAGDEGEHSARDGDDE
jgi:hypothetical protein